MHLDIIEINDRVQEHSKTRPVRLSRTPYRGEMIYLHPPFGPKVTDFREMEWFRVVEVILGAKKIGEEGECHDILLVEKLTRSPAWVTEGFGGQK